MANFLKLNKSYLGPEVLSNGSFEEYGPDLVTNGDFATDSDWIKGPGWTIFNGKASNDGSSGNLQQSSILEVGKVYLITITVSDYVSGNVQVSAGAGPRGNVSANGTYTFIQTAQNNVSFYLVSSAFVGSVESVSVQESGAVELVDNGQFIAVADGTDVTTLSQWSAYNVATSTTVENNELVIVTSGNNQGAKFSLSTIPNGMEVNIKIESVTGDINNGALFLDGSIGSVPTSSGSVDFTFVKESSNNFLYFRSGGNLAGTTSYSNISIQATNQFAYGYERFGADNAGGQNSVFDLQANTVRFIAATTGLNHIAVSDNFTATNQDYLLKIDVESIVGTSDFVWYNGSGYYRIKLNIGENEFRYTRQGTNNAIYFGIDVNSSADIGSSFTLNSISLQEVVNQPKLIGVDNVSMVSAPTDNTVVINNGLTDGADTLTITYAGASASSRVQMRNFFQDSIIRLANGNNTAEVLEITPPVLITDIVAS